jgi:CubicO group peptidase (beta-lactamase class C family)
MLGEWMRYRIEWVGPPGLSIAVTYRGDVVWAAGFGLADVERGVPATPTTVFRGASLTKPITAIAILQLRDAGRLSLEDPVSRFLPWFAEAERAGEGEATRPVRIRDLLSHSAGISNDGPGSYWSDFLFPSEAEVRRALLADEPSFPPGTVFKYSNLGFHLLGEIVAAVSGEPYKVYVQRHVLGSLGMDASTVTPTADMPGLAVGYGRAIPGRERETIPFSQVRGLTPAAGLATTAVDLARLMKLVSGYGGDGVEVLRPSSVREMTRTQFVWPGWSGGYGLGMMVLHMPRDLIGHVSIMNGYAAVFFFDPATGVGVAVLGNALDAELLPGGRLSVADGAIEWLSGPILAAVERSEAAPAFDAAEPHERFTGIYRALALDLQVGRYAGDLVIFDPLHPPPPRALTRLVPEGEARFRAEGRGDPAVSPGAMVEFVGSDAEGRATRLHVSGMSAYRVY